MMILFTLILVFIVVYLYYMILDVRKIQQDIKKLQDDADGNKTATENELKKLTTTTQELQQNQIALSQQQASFTTTANPMQYAQQQHVYYPQQNMYAATVPFVDPQVMVAAPTGLDQTTIDVPVVPTQLHVVDAVVASTPCMDDDIASVTTEDIRNTLDCNDDDDEVESLDVVLSPVDAKEDIGTAKPIDINEKILSKSETLKNMKYEELKELCKAQGLCNKGSKDVLIKRLATQEAVTSA